MPLQATSGAASYDAFGGGVAAGPANYIEDVFSTWLYTGNGSTQTITNGIDLSGKGGLVWCKARTGGTTNHALSDTVRGRSAASSSDTTAAQITAAAGRNITSFNSNGFSLGTDFQINFNPTGVSMASWTFREQEKFFDVVTYTGNGAAPQVVNHSLGSVPGCVIIKRTDSTGDWYVSHRYDFGGSMLILNSTAAAFAAGIGATATTFSVFGATGTALNNVNGATYVAYLFAHNAGGFGLSGTDNVISCGSYTGTGATGNTITLGYEPQYLLTKASSTTGNWTIVDTMRGFDLATDNTLQANTANAEAATTVGFPTATGFTLDTTGNPNASGVTYIYIAIRRGPMKVPTTGTSVYESATRTGTASVIPRYVSGFPVDWTFRKSDVTAVGDWQAGDRLRGAVQVKPNLTEAETAASPLYTFDSMTGYSALAAATNSTNDRSWMFRRAPSFFDVVCYTGTGVARTVTHNLGVAPQLLITKGRSNAIDWYTYSEPTGNANFLLLSADFGGIGSGIWNSTSPTSTQFTVAGANNNNGQTYVAYLFATCPGVSKVGSFIGTGATQTINCGFTGGARFVLIKATSTTGDWYVWDSARGIVAGNDPYLRLNSTAAEVTSTDWVDTAATGFELSNAGGNLANSSGVSYIFLAIA